MTLDLPRLYRHLISDNLACTSRYHWRLHTPFYLWETFDDFVKDTLWLRPTTFPTHDDCSSDEVGRNGSTIPFSWYFGISHYNPELQK